MRVSTNFIIVVVLLALVEWGIIHPLKSVGFYCKDPKFGYKNSGETVSTNILLTVSFILPYFLFLIVEKLSTLKKGKSGKSLWLDQTHLWFLRYLHGLCFTFLVTDLAKFIVGEPRPHFFQTCLPQENFNCTQGCGKFSKPWQTSQGPEFPDYFRKINEICFREYFYKYTCTNNESKKVIADSFKSFPSGHASFSCYSAVFFLVYFTRRIRTDSNLLLNLLQFSCITWALLCSLTRITDYRHHWWDVAIGSILGITVALYFVLYQSKRKEKKEDVEYSTNKEKSKDFKFNLILNPNS